MTDKPELKPCPFCGDNAEIVEDADGLFTIGCVNYGCHATYSSRTSYGERANCIKDWNRRTPRFSQEEREAMELAIRTCELFGGRKHSISEAPIQKAAATLRKMIEEDKADAVGDV